MIDEDGSNNHGEKEKVVKPEKFPFFVLRLALTDFRGRLFEIGNIQHIENRKQQRNGEEPNRPDFLENPKERHAFQITQKKRRIADRSQSSSDIAHQKNKEHDVKRSEPVFV